MAQRPRKLLRTDIRDSFESGAAELDDWFRRFAYENQQANNATTYVAFDGEKIAGYYSLAVAGVDRADAPAALIKGGVPASIPCILLARLAVSLAYQGQGVGWGLLQDALSRTAVISESVGARALLINARDETAKAFYEHHIECHPSPASELQLMVPMKAIRRAFL